MKVDIRPLPMRTLIVLEAETEEERLACARLVAEAGGPLEVLETEARVESVGFDAGERVNGVAIEVTTPLTDIHRKGK